MDYIGQIYKSYYPELTLKLSIVGLLLMALAYFFAFSFFRMSNMPHARLRALAFTAAVLYYYIVLMSTVFTRPEHSDMQYELTPFWSYKRAFAGDKELALEIVLNIIMFMPMGFLITYVVDYIAVFMRKRVYKRALLRLSLLLGIVCSAAIEVLQLLLRRGLFEWDDIIDNTIGFLVGAGVYLVMSGNRRRRKG